MDQSARFGLAFLAPGQMQKEFYHNEALQRIDMLLCPIVEGPALSSPPASPAIGSCYLVGAGATGAWLGQEHALACFTDGGWRFVTPLDGMSLVDRASGQLIARRNGLWETGIVRGQEVQIAGQTVLRNRQAAIANPTGGSVLDTECRSTVNSILSAMRIHGLIS